MNAVTLELTVNGQTMRLEAPVTVAQLLRALERDERRVAVEVNGQLVPRENHTSVQLAAGDAVEIVGFVGGG